MTATETDDRDQTAGTPDRYSYRYNAVHGYTTRPDNRTVTRYRYMHSQITGL